MVDAMVGFVALSRRFPTFLLFACAALAGCDSAADFAGCDDVEDPTSMSGRRKDQCPASSFPPETERGREIAGIVWRGEEAARDAVVRVSPWSGLPSSERLGVLWSSTDAAGVFGGLRTVALRYDLSIRLDSDVIAYQGVAGRYVEPSLESAETEPRAFPRGWTGHVNVRLDAPLPEGRAVAFFANGDGVFGVTGDLATGLSVVARDFVARATLHAVAYDAAGGLETAMAYGKVEVASDASLTTSATLHLDDISVFAQPEFTVTSPPGFAAPSVDVIIGFARTSDARLATVPVGVSKRLPIIPNAGYTYRVHAGRADGAVVSSGETTFNVHAGLTPIALPEAQSVESPLDGESRGPGELLVSSGADGIFEHVLVPRGPGGAIRIVTRQRDAVLPDLRELGAAPSVEGYRWIVRSFPSARFAEDLTGVDSRRYRAMAASAPRTIFLR